MDNKKIKQNTLDDYLKKQIKAQNNITNEEKYQMGKQIKNINNKNRKRADEKAQKIIDEVGNSLAKAIKDAFTKFLETTEYNNTIVSIEEMENRNNINIIQNLYESTSYQFEKKEYTVKSILKDLLDKHGITQRTLVMATGINRGTMSNIINNPESASLMNILKICAVLGVKVEDLFKLEKIINPYEMTDIDEEMKKFLGDTPITNKDSND